MRSAILLLGMLLALHSNAEDFFFKRGYQLRNHCSNLIDRDEFNSSGAFCHGYVLAIVDAMTTQPIAGRRACPNTNSDEIERVVLNYLKRNPALMDDNASSLVARALSEAFPCRR